MTIFTSANSKVTLYLSTIELLSVVSFIYWRDFYTYKRDMRQRNYCITAQVLWHVLITSGRGRTNSCYIKWGRGKGLVCNMTIGAINEGRSSSKKCLIKICLLNTSPMFRKLIIKRSRFHEYWDEEKLCHNLRLLHRAILGVASYLFSFPCSFLLKIIPIL